MQRKATNNYKSTEFHTISVWWSSHMHLHILLLPQHRYFKVQCHQDELAKEWSASPCPQAPHSSQCHQFERCPTCCQVHPTLFRRQCHTSPRSYPWLQRDDLQLLPSSVTKREVWELYHQIEQDGFTAVCYSLFCQLWKKLTPQVVVTKPMSDLCWTCQKNSAIIMRAHNRPVEEKTEVIMHTSVCVCVVCGVCL